MTLCIDKKNCCGCGACAAVCGKKAIALKSDSHGFLYPQINAQLCVECGKCKAVCKFNSLENARESHSRYLARHSSEAVLLGSTSGGMYSALSDVILNNSGVVYAADLCQDMSVRHICITNEVQRDHARGSKYVQSDMSDIYGSMREQLQAGRDVIFFGTPCQVEAVLAVIPEREQSRLYTVDLICNGVGSPMVWQQHVQRLQKRFGKNLSYYWFRPKTKGYLTTSEVCQFQDGTREELKMALNQYNFLYYRGLIHRPSCTACHYASTQRVGDISIGDFSRAEHLYPAFDSTLGASMVLCNTDKGASLLAQAQLHMQRVTKEDCSQARLNSCAGENSASAAFLTACAENGLEKAIQRKISFLRRMRIRLMASIRGVKQ